MLDAPSLRRLALLTGFFALVRLATAVVVSQPGYTDAYYFTDVAARLAHGNGLTADFLWSPVEAARDPATLSLPVASHVFWVPLATVIAAVGIALFGSVLDTFGAAQLPIVLIALALPAVTFVAARRIGASQPSAVAASAIVGFGGLFAPGLVSIDVFAPAAVLGTAFFLTYERAAEGRARAGVLAGVIVGLLYLARSEAALFGLALLALVAGPTSRRAGVAGTLVALAIGSAWLLRDLTTGVSADLFARSALLVRYEDFFAFDPEYFPRSASSVGDFIGPRATAVLTNAVTFAFAYGLLLLGPLAVGLRALRARADVRAWAALTLLVYLAQSLVWTLHSTRGSYFHSLAAFFPFGVAIAARGADRLLGGRTASAARVWAVGVVALVALVSAGAVSQWDAAFNSGAAARVAALNAIPTGPFLAIDAAAWRWLSGRTVAVTPADGLGYAACVALRTDARSIVLEAAHFRRYDELYRAEERPAWLDPPVDSGTIRIFAIRGEPPCAGSSR